MGTSVTTNLFFLVASFLLLSSLLHPHVLVTGDADLIKKTCKSTSYYALCMSSLKSNSSSLKADTKGLADIMIGIGMNSAISTCNYLNSQLLSVGNNDTASRKVVRECAEKYFHANEALEEALLELDSMSLDYAVVALIAARDYPNVCHNAFKRSVSAGGVMVYPIELKKREGNLEHICDVALGIIDLLA